MSARVEKEDRCDCTHVNSEETPLTKAIANQTMQITQGFATLGQKLDKLTAALTKLAEVMTKK